MRKNIVALALTLAAVAAPVMCEASAKRVSPLTTYPSVSENNGIYQTAEGVSAGQVGEAIPGSAYRVSVSGTQLTTGYKFDQGRVEYTYMRYESDDTNPLLQRTSMSANAWHAAYTIPMKQGYGEWTGDAQIGIRYFSNDVGELGEVYVSREFNKEYMSFTLGVNALERSTRFEHRIGFYADGRYDLTDNLSVMGQYYSADFYKNILNDYVSPFMYAVPQSKLGCEMCAEDTASIGLSLSFLKGRGNAYLMYYYMGEQYDYIPMFGLTAKL